MSAKDRSKWTNEIHLIIQQLDLDDEQKTYIFNRWHDQILWFEKRADNSYAWYRILMLSTLICSILTPVFATLAIANENVYLLKLATIVISLLVAISTGVEKSLHLELRSRRFRETSESLKVEGWMFFSLTGTYQVYTNHQIAFSYFANQIDAIISRDLAAYITYESLKSRHLSGDPTTDAPPPPP